MSVLLDLVVGGVVAFGLMAYLLAALVLPRRVWGDDHTHDRHSLMGR